MDFQQVRTDPDLEFLRADSRFEVSVRGSMLAPPWPPPRVMLHLTHAVGCGCVLPAGAHGAF